jgi:hypothetical protein
LTDNRLISIAPAYLEGIQVVLRGKLPMTADQIRSELRNLWWDQNKKKYGPLLAFVFFWFDFPTEDHISDALTELRRKGHACREGEPQSPRLRHVSRTIPEDKFILTPLGEMAVERLNPSGCQDEPLTAA